MKMEYYKIRYFLILFSGFVLGWVNSGSCQDTFSIIAVDSVTGEVGSAGASCLDNIQFPGSGGVLIISDVLPGKGAIHTQSYWEATNQANAQTHMLAGASPQEILDWLQSNDVDNNPTIRQYGIVDFDENGSPRTAAFTGTNCMDYKNHITGSNYAIQGNILLGQAILEQMEINFLNTQGSLANKLMAALQGAKIPGADSRCLDEGVSSLSAFIRVARLGDSDGNYYLDLNVPSTPFGFEPIDSLQTLFDLWAIANDINEIESKYEVRLFPNPSDGKVRIELDARIHSDKALFKVYDNMGRKAYEFTFYTNELVVDSKLLPSGAFFYEISLNGKTIKTGKLLFY